MKPILFSTPMVQAILDGRKTQTRRVIPDTDCAGLLGIVYADTFVAKQHPDKIGYAGFEDYRGEFFKKPIAQIGDILYVKETFSVLHGEGTSPLTSDAIAYKADNDEASKLLTKHKAWKPSLFMPQAYARIFLKVTNVRAERLQDISEEDAIAEGIESNLKNCIMYKDYSNGYFDYDYPTDSYRSLWNSINKKEPEKQWDTNPYVFVYEFERVAKPEVIA